MLRKALFSFAAIVAALSMALPTHAATTLNWTDLSSQLTVRTNRPVWAMAYANGNWFYTDGQDLWNGGQVYRYDGATQTNITLNVRNAGINRVDDIVSDGQSVIFLGYVATKSNIVVGLRYTGGSYTNVTSALRSVFASDETISMVTGKNGSWRIVSTFGRVFTWDGISTPSQVALPSELQSRINDILSTQRTGYPGVQNAYVFGNYLSQHNGMLWPDGPKLIVVPIANNNWLVMLTGQYPYVNHMNGTTFNKVSSDWISMTNVDWVGSNGETAFIVGNVGIAYHNDPESVVLWNGQGTNSLLNINTTGLSFYSNGKIRAHWDGQSWIMVTPNKHIILVTGTASQDLGEARDLFVTGASNGNGTTLLGGAVSVLGNMNPTSPLTAKLSKVTESTVVPTQNNNSQTYGNLSTWTWLDPNVGSIANNQTATFNVGAWGSKGLSRIDIVVNGVTRRSCTYATAYGNQNCSYTLYGGDYNVGTTISMNAMITGADGKTMWSPLTNLSITNTNGTTYNPYPTNTNSNTSVWVWSSPEVSTIASNGSATFNVGATDADGISKIELYVNGSIWKTCNLGTGYNYQTCALTVNGSSFTAGSDVFVNGKVTDIYGNTTWTGSRSYRIVSAASTASNQTANWIWSSPDISSLTVNQSATFNVGAWDADGLNRTEVWVNGQLKQTCNFGNIVGNRDCSFTINANSYAVGTNVFVNAMMVDANGNTTWSASRSYAITSSMYNQTTPTFPTNLPGSVSVTSNRDGGYSNNQYITYTASATDQNGLDRVELYVNGMLVKTCYNVSTCSWTGGYYNTRNYVNYGATIVDKAGFALWTGYKTIAKK